MNRDDVFLSDEQIADLLIDYPPNTFAYELITHGSTAQLKKLVEWGFGNCNEHFPDSDITRFECWSCQTELKELAGVE